MPSSCLISTATAQPTLTIGQLAKQAGVGIETIRYYQKRALLPDGVPVTGTVKRYPQQLVQRVNFIKRAQKLGFLLEEIAQLLRLDDETERGAIRHLASERLQSIQQKIADLQQMEKVLHKLVHACAESETQPRCPIIASLSGDVQA